MQQLLLRGLERHQLFFSAALPKQISPPLFNRYRGATNSFGNHVDSAVRFLRDGTGRVRTDISCTLFLAEPQDYGAGELVIEDTYAEQRVKLVAGDMVLYPGTSVHRVLPVRWGFRTASYSSIQSMVRSDEQRRLLFDMDSRLRHLRSTCGETDPGVIGLTSTCITTCCACGSTSEPESATSAARKVFHEPVSTLYRRQPGCAPHGPGFRPVRRPCQGALRAAGRSGNEAADGIAAQARQRRLEGAPGEEFQWLLRGLRLRRKRPARRGVLPSHDLREGRASQAALPSAESMAQAHPMPESLRVWDLPVRWLHWILVAAVGTAWFTGEGSLRLHEVAGYAALSVVAARGVWGCLGGRYARFTQFVHAPRIVSRYARDVARHREARHLGHNRWADGWWSCC